MKAENVSNVPSSKFAKELSTIEGQTDRVEDFLRKVFTSPLSAKDRAKILMGASATASAMARNVLDNEIGPIE